MKPVKVDNPRVHAVITQERVYLVLTDDVGKTITFEPPPSPVTQRWAQEMRDNAFRGEQLRLDV